MVKLVVLVHQSVAKSDTVLLQSVRCCQSFLAKKNLHTQFVWSAKFCHQTVQHQWLQCAHQACRSWTLAFPLRRQYLALQWVSSMQKANTSHSPTFSVQKTHSVTWTSKLPELLIALLRCSLTPRSTEFPPMYCHQLCSRHVMHV